MELDTGESKYGGLIGIILTLLNELFPTLLRLVFAGVFYNSELVFSQHVQVEKAVAPSCMFLPKINS